MLDNRWTTPSERPRKNQQTDRMAGQQNETCIFTILLSSAKMRSSLQSTVCQILCVDSITVMTRLDPTTLCDLTRICHISDSKQYV